MAALSPLRYIILGSLLALLVVACVREPAPTPIPRIGEPTRTVIAETPAPTAVTRPSAESGASRTPNAAAAPTPSPVPIVQAASAAPTPVPTTKTIHIGLAHEPDTISGWPGGMYASAVVQNLLFNVLVAIDDQMQPYPDLAVEVPTLENGGARFIGEGADRQLQVTFEIRPGLTWSDGTPVTARDVVFTWELMINPHSGAVPDTELKYESVTAIGDSTVVFTFFSERTAREAAAQDPDRYGRFKDQSGPVVDPLYIFGLPNSYIYPAHVLGPLVDNQPRTSERAGEIFTTSTFARSPIGSGPYLLTEWVAGTSLTFAARDDYFKGTPKIATVVFEIVPKVSRLIELLESGEIQVIAQGALNVADAPALDKLTNANVYYTPGTSWEHLDLNLADPILADANVRQAIYLGIDRQELIDKVMLGKATVLDSVILEWSPFQTRDVPKYRYDPRRATELLEQSGWQLGTDGIREKNGEKLRLKLQTTDAPFRMKAAPLIQDQLRRIGIDVVVEHLPAKTYFDEVNGPMAQRTFQLGLYAWVSGVDPGADSRLAFHSSSIPTSENERVGENYPGYHNPQVDRLLERGLETFDVQQRTEIYHEFQQIVMTELPTLPLYVHPNVSAASTRLVNFKPPRAGIGETWNVHEWDLR